MPDAVMEIERATLSKPGIGAIAVVRALAGPRAAATSVRALALLIITAAWAIGALLGYLILWGRGSGR